MHKTFLFLSTACFSFLLSNAQISENDILLTISGEPISANEFMRVYNKNLNLVQDDSQKEVDSYLELFVNYKLKLTEAKALRYDKDPVYLNEFKSYKNQLTQTYLTDKNVTDDLVCEAYERTENEVKAQHILVLLDEVETDTLAAYSKIEAYRERFLNEDFESLKKELHNGKSVFVEDLGYFSAFKMVYNFESAAYATEVGSVSQPFRTRFGFHVVKVLEKRKSKGQVSVAHIMIANTQKDSTLVAKDRIQELHRLLLQGEDFGELAKQFSDDPGSKNKGGNLGKFAAGRMVKPFSDAAFALENVNDFSEPFKTRFGWHIVKLIKKHPIKSFDEMKKDLKAKVKKSSRMQLSEKAVVNKLKKEYSITEFKEAKKILERKNLRSIPKDSLQNTIIRINDKKVTQEDFINYIRNRRHLAVFKLFEMFKEDQIIKYYKENLIHTEPEYAYTLKEYEDGLLLFELMQEKIWTKSTKDSLGLKKYFKTNSKNYKTDDLKAIKGQVINDYQNFLEKNWISELRKNSEIKVEKKQLKKLIKFYGQN